VSGGGGCEQRSERLLRLVLERERVLPSGLEDELAVPNARVNGLTRPLVWWAKSEGIDFNARDGKPARLIIMILTGDNQSQHDLLGDPASYSATRKRWSER